MLCVKIRVWLILGCVFGGVPKMNFPYYSWQKPVSSEVTDGRIISEGHCPQTTQNTAVASSKEVPASTIAHK